MTTTELPPYEQPVLPSPRRIDDLVAPELEGGPSRLWQIASTTLWSLVGVAALIGLLKFGSSKVADLPDPGAVFTELKTLFSHPFTNDGPNGIGIGLLVLYSLQRVAWGFVLACLVGIPLGLAMGASRKVWQAINPVVQLLRPVSPLAWFPIWLIVFKDSPKAATWVLFITALWPIVINTAAGAQTIPDDQRNVARVFRFSRLSYVRYVMVPHALGPIVTGMRQAMGVAWMVIVAVEMLSAVDGIGNYVWNSYNASSYSKVISAIIVIGATGYLIDLAFLKLAARFSTQEAAS